MILCFTLSITCGAASTVETWRWRRGAPTTVKVISVELGNKTNTSTPHTALKKLLLL
jgi:hypothetical protein